MASKLDGASRDTAADAIYVNWQWGEHDPEKRMAVTDKESLTSLVRLQSASKYYEMTGGDSQKLEKWIGKKAGDAKVSDDELALLRKTQNVDYTNIRYFEPIDRQQEIEARKIDSLTVSGVTYDRTSEFGMDVFGDLARKEKDQIERLDFSKARETAVEMSACKLWLADREKEFAKDPDRDSKIKVTENDRYFDEPVRLILNKDDLSLRATAEIRAQATTLSVTKEDEIRLDRWLEEKGKVEGLKPRQVEKLVKSFDVLYEDVRAHEKPDKLYDAQASKVSEVVVQDKHYLKDAPDLYDGLRALAKEEQKHFWKLDFAKAEAVTVKMEAVARWIEEKEKGKARAPEKESSLSKDVGSGSVLRGKLREKSKAKESENSAKSELEKDISKDDLI